MKRFFTPLSIFISLCIMVGVCSPAVHAENVSYNDFWAYHYIEQYCGVDLDQYQETDNGSSFWDIVERYGTNSIESTMNACTDSVKNTMSANGADEWAINQVDIYADYAKEVLQNNITTSQAVANYTQEKLSRTFHEGEKVFLNVSGDGFWNSIYNDLFNNNGYKQQYQVTSSDFYGGTYNGNTYSIRLAFESGAYFQNPVDTSVFKQLYTTKLVYEYPDTRYAEAYLIVTVNGIEYYTNSGFGNGMWDNFTDSQILSCSISGNNLVTAINTKYYGIWYNGLTFVNGSEGAENPESGSDSIPKPKSCGVIRLNGDWVDVPVNPEDRPTGWVLNDDGTVTIDGQDYPIYIEIDSGDDGGSGGGDGGGSGDGGGGDDGQLTPDGMFQIIKTIGDTPFGNVIGNNPNENYNQPDGNNNSNPFGLDIGGFFGNIVKAIGNALKSVFGSILEILKKFLNFIVEIIKGNWFSNLKSPNFDTMFDFSLIQTMITKFFEALGVEV